MTKNAYFGPNLAVFGPKVLIFMGVSKSFRLSVPGFTAVFVKKHPVDASKSPALRARSG